MTTLHEIPLTMKNYDKPADIILADDDNDEVLLFEMALQQVVLRFTLRHAVNGEKLFDLLREQIPDILFLDIRMPCKDGISCITEIRSDRKYDKMPVIMYSSLKYSSFVEETYRKGANLFIEKASTVEELTAKLKKVFSVNWQSNMLYPEFAAYSI